MTFETILFILVFILPVYYKYSFWLYTIQLKEYRWDRFREYICTPQWKKAVFNFWFFIEVPLLIATLTIYIDKAFEFFIYSPVFYFLVFYNIFVIWKLKRKKFIKPKITWRLLITILFLLLWFLLDLYFIFFNWYNLSIFWYYDIIIYSYIMWILLFSPVIIFLVILLTLPLVNFLKNRKIKKAIKKSEEINDVIKIWITWSYGKSSVKEFLSSILEQDSPHSISPKGREVAQEGVLKTPENQNTEMSVSALVLNKLNNKLKYFVAEMWAYRIGEISLLWKIANHKYWFLTAIGNQHIWLFWSQENIAKWKFEIYESVAKNNWILYVNWDCEEINKYLKKNKLITTVSPHLTSPKGRGIESKIIKYWIKSENILDAKSEIISVENNVTKFQFNYKNHTNIIFEINLVWEHNVVNLTWVIACCIDLWLKIEDIKKYLKNLKSPENTKSIIAKWENILIDDTYNLSEAGLKSGLELFKNYNKQGSLAPCKILILDDILELWKEAEIIHKNIWKEIAENKLCDKVLFCGANYKKSFVEWLLEWWFDEENILSTEGFNPLQKSVILFEGKRAKRYLRKLI